MNESAVRGEQRADGDAPQTLTNRYHDWVTLRWYEVLRQRKEDAVARGALREALALASRLSEAIVVRPEDVLPKRVQFGARVTVFAIEEGEEQTFQIVSDDEASIVDGLLSAQSPLAQALFGAQEGDEVEVHLPSGSSCIYEVTHITAPG